MARALNIKDAEAVRLAGELAQVTGLSLTQAVREALARCLTAVRDEDDAAFRAWARDMALSGWNGPLDATLEAIQDPAPPARYDGWS